MGADLVQRLVKDTPGWPVAGIAVPGGSKCGSKP